MIEEVVILAAGVGSRMAEITKDRPKCMAPFLGGTILSRLLGQLRPYKPRKIHIVGGYKVEVLRAYLEREEFQDLPINLLNNDRFAGTNSIGSAAIALAVARGQLLILNSDVVYQAELIRRMYESVMPFAFSLDQSDYNEESEKLAINPAGRVVQIAKTLSEKDATGCSADLYRINTEASDQVVTRLLNRFLERPQAARCLFEDFLDQCILAQDFTSVDVTGLEWYEIDTAPELLDAERVFVDIV